MVSKIWVLLLMVFISVSSSFSEEVMEKPKWNVGDLWIYKEISIIKGREPKEQILSRKFIGEEDGFYVLITAQNWKIFLNQKLNEVVRRDDKGKEIERYEPEKPFYIWPLKVGNFLKYEYRWLSPKKGPDDPPFVTGTIKVEKIESIKIMGEEILTFKLVNDRYNPKGLLVAEIIHWVSPKFKNVVKWKDVRTRAGKYYEAELTKYVSGKEKNN